MDPVAFNGSPAMEDWLLRFGPACLPERALADGSDFGPFRVLGLLGKGGSSEVCRARRRDDGTVVALKVPNRDDESVRERLRREARFLAEHPHRALPRLIASGEENGIPWLALEELVPGPLPRRPRDVARFVLALCNGLAFLHSLGFVHRDVKPGNILFRAGAEPVLIDLGLVKQTHVGGRRAKRESSASDLIPTMALSVVDGRAVGLGTPGYSAPEQFAGGDLSPAADVYALGMLSLRCFSGSPPFGWRNLLRRATSPLPAGRFPDAATFARAVRTRRWPAAAFLLASVLSAAVVFAFAFGHDETGSAKTAAAETRPVRTPVPPRPAPPPPNPVWTMRPAPRLGESLGRPDLGLLTGSANPWEPFGTGERERGIRSFPEGSGDSVLSVPVAGLTDVSFRYRVRFPSQPSGPVAPSFRVLGLGKVLFSVSADETDTNVRFARVSVPPGASRLLFVCRGAPGGAELLDLKTFSPP